MVEVAGFSWTLQEEDMKILSFIVDDVLEIAHCWYMPVERVRFYQRQKMGPGDFKWAPVRHPKKYVDVFLHVAKNAN